VAFGLVSAEKALSAYGVVIGDPEATEAERARQREERGDALAFDFGPPLEEALANCEAETGLPAPVKAVPLRWSPLESRESALERARNG
jgi:N-methylhydantoinase B